MNIPPPEVRFSRNATILGQAALDGIRTLNRNGYTTVSADLVSIAVTVISSFDSKYLIEGFIRNSHLFWDQILAKDEGFFVKNSGKVFCHLPGDKVNLFCDLFCLRTADGKSVISEELKDQIWGLMIALVKIAIKYTHENRGPQARSSDSGLVEGYKCPNFLDEVTGLVEHAAKWGVKLDFPMLV
jgi:hypothetical protein